jgi:hypothetical protein
VRSKSRGGDGDFKLHVDTQGDADPDIIVELMARDVGHLVNPQKENPDDADPWIEATGTHVWDPNHNRDEIHPVFEMRFRGQTYRSGPQHADSPPPQGNIAGPKVECWRPDGSECGTW